MKGLYKTLRRLWAAYRVLAPYGDPHRRNLLHGAIATLVLVAARLAFPWPLRGLLELVFHNNNIAGSGQGVVGLVPNVGDPAVWLIGAFVVIILVWGVAESLQRLAFTRYAVGLMQGLREAALARLPERGGRGVRGVRTPGDVLATITGDTSRVKTGVKSILIGISRNGVFFLGVTVIVTIIDPIVGLVFLTGGLAVVVAGAIGASHSSVILRRSRRREGALTDGLHRYLAGEGVVAAPAAADRGDRKADSKVTRVEGLTTFAVHTILAAATCAILILTIQDGRSGELSPGAVFTVLAYILLMHNKTVGLGRSIVRVGRVLPSAERVARMVRRPPRRRTVAPSVDVDGAHSVESSPSTGRRDR